MSCKKPICAILYDFDSTLATTDMQNFGFIPRLGMTPAEFWAKTGEFSRKTGCEKILSYLFVMNQAAKEKGIPSHEVAGQQVERLRVVTLAKLEEGKIVSPIPQRTKSGNHQKSCGRSSRW